MTPPKHTELSWETPCKDLGHHAIADSRSELWKQAWSEWELTQKKIDSVSNFPFTVKTWSMTFAGIAAVAGKAYAPDIASFFGCLFILCLVLIPIVFYGIEKHHKNVRDTLGKRALQLEGLLEDLDSLNARLPNAAFSKMQSRQLKQLPGLARLLISETRSTKGKQIRWRTPSGKWTVVPMLLPNARLFWEKSFILNCDVLFYRVQILLIISIMFLPKQTKPESVNDGNNSVVSGNHYSEQVHPKKLLTNPKNPSIPPEPFEKPTPDIKAEIVTPIPLINPIIPGYFDQQETIFSTQ